MRARPATTLPLPSPYRHSHPMRPSSTIVRRLLAASLLLVAASACSSTDASPLAGSYVATTFQVTPTGQSMIDVLAQGGTLGISITDDNSTSGTLFVPASVAGTAITESMAGTAVQTGNTVRFTQSSDTFVRDLTFTVNGSTLQVVNQPLSGATFNVVLTRQ
jgi:hypothetical protein